MPSLAGTSSGSSTRNAKQQADRVTARGQFTLPGTAGEVPAKSTVSPSPSIVAVTRIGMSSSLTPSPSTSPTAVYRPSGRLAIIARLRRSP